MKYLKLFEMFIPNPDPDLSRSYALNKAKKAITAIPNIDRSNYYDYNSDDSIFTDIDLDGEKLIIPNDNKITEGILNSFIGKTLDFKLKEFERKFDKELQVYNKVDYRMSKLKIINAEFIEPKVIRIIAVSEFDVTFGILVSIRPDNNKILIDIKNPNEIFIQGIPSPRPRSNWAYSDSGIDNSCEEFKKFLNYLKTVK